MGEVPKKVAGQAALQPQLWGPSHPWGPAGCVQGLIWGHRCGWWSAHLVRQDRTKSLTHTEERPLDTVVHGSGSPSRSSEKQEPGKC